MNCSIVTAAAAGMGLALISRLAAAKSERQTAGSCVKTGPLSGKHILVTGGAGYIGSHTVLELHAAGAQITIIDNYSNSSPLAVERINELANHKFPCLNVDIRDPVALEAVFKNCSTGKFDAVVHFAGLKAVGESTQIPLLYYENNIIGSLHLFMLMEKYDCTNIVFSSSATVYGEIETVPAVETMPLSATNAYGRSKLQIEDILRDTSRGKTGKRWRIALLRYFNPFGAHPSGCIGEDPNGPPNNLVPYISQVAVGRREILSVFGNDYPTKDGTGVRDYIHVVDLAKGHVAALTKGIFGKMQESGASQCEAYNLGTGKGYSVLEMVAAMEKACGHKVPYKITPRRPGDIAEVYGDVNKSLAELGWRTELDLETGMADTWRWQSRNPRGYE